MKKYLHEIELAGILLLVIGVAIALFLGYNYGAWPCGIGLMLLLASFLYKAFHWEEYAAENKRNIITVLFTILLLILTMLFKT